MTASEPGGARAPADPERLAEAERRIRAAAEWTDHHRRRYVELSPADLRDVLAEYDRRGSEIERLRVWVTERDERIACLEDERDEARDELAQRGEIMREQGAELRDAERAAYHGWCADQDGAR